MTVKLLDHVNIHTADLAGTVDFYVDVIGLKGRQAADHPRPPGCLALLQRPAADSPQ
jgi:catechol 2,3-dioxygenase-like lactoylglutathione lyase family enzyme